MQLNLNADLGESFGPWPMGDDTRLLKIVNTANVACGFHAGDPLVMRNTIALAAQNKVSIGAHPGFPDLQGFGRRPMRLPDDELAAAVIYQLGALDALCRAEGVTMGHVKPHGALNNLACEDRQLADTIVTAIAQYRSDLVLLAPVTSALAAAGEAAGLRLALEVFADRTYNDNGSLVSRSEPGAVIDNAADCIAHVQRMIDAGGIVTASGRTLQTRFHSVCVHGDNAHAVDTAAQLKQALLNAGHDLLPLPAVLSA
jgi:UPF0271 protein